MEENYHYKTIAKAIQFIHDNKREQPSLDEMAKHVHLSKFHFQRLFQEWSGVSPKVFLQYLTITDAKTSLRNGKSTLESAHGVGLSGNSRLHDLFLKIEACTPGEFKGRGKGLVIHWHTLTTSFGLAMIGETEKGICSIAFGLNENVLFQELKDKYANSSFQHELGMNSLLVKKYFDGWQVPSEKIRLDLKGTPFQVQVWKALLQIPSSQLVSYQDIGRYIERPQASRAVGTAVGKNPIAYLIPCHRVIKADGVMGKYRWGNDRKASMIGFEKAKLS